MKYFQTSKAKIRGLLAVVAVVSVGVIAVMQRDRMPPNLLTTENDEELLVSSELTTTTPKLVSGSSSILLLGTVLSNETANIYPRRDGIIEDIYVDIGDTVEANQVVALLLPKGVEGLSAAKISEKLARKSQAESDLSTATQVAENTIINTKQLIAQKETDLMVAIREQESLIQKFREADENVFQKNDQAFTTVQQSRKLIEWIAFGGNSRTGADIHSDALLYNLGIQDSSNASRYDIIAAINALYDEEQKYTTQPDIDQLLTLTLDALRITNTILQFTPSEPNANGIDSLSYTQLADRISQVVAAENATFKAKEGIEDARNMFRTISAAEPELYAAYRSGIDSGAKSNNVRKFEEQIATAKTGLGLTEAAQNQIVEQRRSMLGIASAALNAEYASSGHRKILSPFAGTVSRRFVHVGQIVMPSHAAFELTDVPTSLAERAKAEVQFGLLEYMQSALSLGDTIQFILQSDESTEYTAEVTRMSPQVDMQTHTVTVQAKIPDDISLTHQSSVRIRIVDTSTPVFRLPSSVVKREDDRNYIWIADPDSKLPLKLTVSVTAEDGEFAEVTGALEETTNVIIDPPELFND
jgi:multidrug efflux pump subunit AcrA (membrane-fusion protein)